MRKQWKVSITFLFTSLYPKDWFLLGSYLMDQMVPSARKWTTWYVIHLNTLEVTIVLTNDLLTKLYLDTMSSQTQTKEVKKESLLFPITCWTFALLTSKLNLTCLLALPRNSCYIIFVYKITWFLFPLWGWGQLEWIDRLEEWFVYIC